MKKNHTRSQQQNLSLEDTNTKRCRRSETCSVANHLILAKNFRSETTRLFKTLGFIGHDRPASQHLPASSIRVPFFASFCPYGKEVSERDNQQPSTVSEQ